MKNTYIKVKPSVPGGGGDPGSDEWTRPEDWVPLPELIEGQQKVVGLHAVWGDSDFVAFNCRGNYTVDWGDGTVENFVSNSLAQHLFNYDALEGTECSEGYRQAIVTITPQDGQNLTHVTLNIKHSTTLLPNYTGGWLDISIVGNSISVLKIWGNPLRPSNLRKFTFIGSNLITSAAQMFMYCHKLYDVSFDYTGFFTSTDQMFYHCYSLRTLRMFDTTLVTSMSGMFSNCISLQAIPLFNTPNVINMNNMFSDCASLRYVPLFDTHSVQNMSNMFLNCYSLVTIPLFDTSNVINMSGMFTSCSSLQDVSLLNTSKLTSAISFTNCFSLQKIPPFNFTNLVTVGNIFSGCYSLQQGKLIGTIATISYFGLKLSAAQIEAIFDGLAIVSGKTITITNNWGVANLTAQQREIATNKGWTIIS